MDLAAVVNEVGAPRVALMGHYIGTPAAVIAMLNEPERYTHLMLHLPIPMGGDRSGMIQHSEVTELIDSTVENLLRLGWLHHDEAARRALLTMIAPTAGEDTLRNLSQIMHHYPVDESTVRPHTGNAGSRPARPVTRR